MAIETLAWGKTKNNECVKKYVLSNDKIKLVVSDFGATLTNLYVNDKNGDAQDVVWGYDTVDEYENNGFFFGGIIGRNANRIAKARVDISGKICDLDKNDGENNLHSGFNGYHKRIWNVEKIEDLDSKKSIIFSLDSKDMDQGFPGNAKVYVTYTVFEEKIEIVYNAKSDKKTIFNMTNHSYFNLEGQSSVDVKEQEVWIDADCYTPVDEEYIPTGKLENVENTCMDFRTPRKIADGEYDHNYCLNNTGKFRKVAMMKSGKSGINMNVYTDLDGMQFYTSNMLNSNDGKDGRSYLQHSAACFETQYFPDACNQENFKSCIFDANEEYKTKTVYEFLLEN